MVTAVILLIAKFSGPKLAGAIGGLPIVFAISYILITQQNRNAARSFLVGGVYGALAGIFFSILLIWLNAQFPKYFWVNFGAAYLLCFFFAFGLAWYTSK